MKGITVPHLIQCSRPGCGCEFETRSCKSNGLLCPVCRALGRRQNERQWNERRRNGDKIGRPAGGTLNVKTVEITEKNKCSSCAFLCDCRYNLNRGAPMYCSPEYRMHYVYLRHYGRVEDESEVEMEMA